MKKVSRSMMMLFVVTITIALVSWNRFTAPGKNPEKNQRFDTNDDWYQSPLDPEKIPSAEDVLVQRIAGDKNHVLMMAFYSKERYAGRFVTLDRNGQKLVFRDDGLGDDKVASDGLFTAKIEADLSAFKGELVSKLQEMKKSQRKQLRYVNRNMVDDPDLPENVEVQQFDKNVPVSLAALSVASTESADAAVIDDLRANSEFITNLGVVEDPTRTWNPCAQTGNANGPWTFGTLMRQLASRAPNQIATDAQVSDFVKAWLNNWASRQIINGDTCPARTAVNSIILNPWITKSQNAGGPTGQLDMKFAPFKLTAFVNRFDLRNRSVGNPAGEARMVFCLLNSNCNAALRMTVIFEYHVNVADNCSSLQNWASQWFNLKDLTIGSAAYNQALQNITDKFTLSGTDPTRPHQSSLNHLRTDDIALAGTPARWELREFVLNGTTHNLEETTMTQVAADRYNAGVTSSVDNPDVRLFVTFVNQNKSTINNKGLFDMPATFQGTPFLGSKTTVIGSPTGNNNPYHWDGQRGATSGPTFIKKDNPRHFISLFACSGCHAGETQTGFTHVDPVFFGTQATLSGFLTGRAGSGGAVDADGDPNNDLMSVRDAAARPTGNPTVRTFSDIKRRAQDLKKIAKTSCASLLTISSDLMFEPIGQVH